MKFCYFCKYEGKQEDCWGILRRCNNPHHEHCLDDVLDGAECKYFKRKSDIRILLESIFDKVKVDWIIGILITVALIILMVKMPVLAYEYCFDKTCQTIADEDIDHVETFKIKDKYFLKVVYKDGHDDNFCYGKDYLKLYSDFDDTLEMETFKKGISWKEYYERYDHAVQRN